jgi:antitoxin (DNA-binding transcriptional repressor) of toxin-antitoxin stability system
MGWGEELIVTDHGIPVFLQTEVDGGGLKVKRPKTGRPRKTDVSHFLLSQ